MEPTINDFIYIQKTQLNGILSIAQEQSHTNKRRMFFFLFWLENLHSVICTGMPMLDMGNDRTESN